MDVTRRHEAEQERAGLQARLAQAHRMEVVGRLAGGVAHDFNNLLTVILACGFDLRDRLRAGEPGDAETVDDILAAGQRAAELTRQLLAFARKQVLAPTLLDVNEILLQSRKLLARVIGEDVRITEDLQDGLWTVRADSGLLSQVVMNLAVNARDAMPRGGNLAMSTANVELGPGDPPPDPDMAPGRYVRLRVSDTGVGMGPEVLEHVFEPFFTTKPVGAGTGLGLATAYGNVKQSGGHVVVQSQLGSGSTFDVYLPALAPGETPELVRPVSTTGGSESVLVVEDDAKVREIVDRSLGSAGYRVAIASSGEEALRQVHEGRHPVDLLHEPFTAESLLAGVRAVLDAGAPPAVRE
jgi:signal transduction histidine kinase